MENLYETFQPGDSSARLVNARTHWHAFQIFDVIVFLDHNLKYNMISNFNCLLYTLKFLQCNLTITPVIPVVFMLRKQKIWGLFQ